MLSWDKQVAIGFVINIVILQKIHIFLWQVRKVDQLWKVTPFCAYSICLANV